MNLTRCALQGSMICSHLLTLKFCFFCWDEVRPPSNVSVSFPSFPSGSVPSKEGWCYLFMGKVISDNMGAVIKTPHMRVSSRSSSSSSLTFYYHFLLIYCCFCCSHSIYMVWHLLCFSDVSYNILVLKSTTELCIWWIQNILHQIH